MITLGQLLQGVDGARMVGCDATTPIRTVATDSRRVGAGDLFVALAGASHDAHRFVPEVLAHGAAAVVPDPTTTFSRYVYAIDDTDGSVMAIEYTSDRRSTGSWAACSGEA